MRSPMRGKDFLEVARRAVKGVAEADWRDAAGRAYYALFLESRDALRRWGFVLPRRDQVHAAVRLRFIYAADADLKRIGYLLEDLGAMRNHADYQLDNPGKWFTSAKDAEQAILDAEA